MTPDITDDAIGMPVGAVACSSDILLTRVSWEPSPADLLYVRVPWAERRPADLLAIAEHGTRGGPGRRAYLCSPRVRARDLDALYPEEAPHAWSAWRRMPAPEVL